MGYIPVKKNPVINLNTSNENKSLAMRRIITFEIAPRIEENKNIFRGEYLSDNAKKAKMKDKDILLSNGQMVRSGVLIDKNKKNLIAEHPQHIFTRWYGYALSFPDPEIYE